MKIVYVHSFDEYYQDKSDKKYVEELVGKVFINPIEEFLGSSTAELQGWSGLNYILGDKEIPIHEKYCLVRTLDSYLEDTEF